MPLQPILVANRWQPSQSTGTFRADNPATREPLPDEYPVSSWADVDLALSAASAAFEELRRLPAERLARFLERFAERIEQAKPALVELAHSETALPKAPRLGEVELPRTVTQLRQAAAAAREGSWAMATIDTKANIRSYLAPIGPVVVFGPNNFPFAFNSASGGDFAAAIAAGNPVIAKANTSHPGTTRLFAVEAQQAAAETELPAGTVQLLYRTSHDVGERLAADPRVGAIGYTGSRKAGLALKSAADRVGKPIYLELSSVNPVVILPGALRERAADLAAEFTQSCLMGTGQFCTNPGLVFLLASPESEAFIAAVAGKFQSAPVGTLLSKGVAGSLAEAVGKLQWAGAQLLTQPAEATGAPNAGYSHPNTLLRVTAREFILRADELQTEAFGNASLFVLAETADELAEAMEHLEGNLTGCFYTDKAGSDDELYRRLEPAVRQRVGRLLNDKMPTGVAVSPAMNHGGPFPATGHPGFTAVGIPAALRRFAMLQCYDNVRPNRLPPLLADQNPCNAWRLIDGQWTRL